MFNETNANNATEADAAARNHNFLADCAATILSRYDNAKAASRNSLEDLRVVGERLNDAKEALAGTKKGAFGEWCEAQEFPFDKTWRARLMKLAANWDEIIAAVEALPEDRRKWSVDGVLAIWAASKKAEAATEGSNGEGAEGEGGNAEPKAKKETEAEKLRRLLAEALAEVERLRKENEALKGGPKGKSKAKQEEAPQGDDRVNAATKSRARKVWNLFTRGATDGEKAAAESRLNEMASKAGLSFEEFCTACGLA